MKEFLNSPFVVLPTVAAALGLTLVPFVVWDTNNAAQFYGSFFAAIVAATAAFSGYFVQNRLAEAREEKKATAKHLSETVDLYFWLRYIQIQLKRALRTLERKLSQDDQPPNDTVGFFKLAGVERKKICLSTITEETRVHAAKALRLPPEARVVVAGRMYDVCEVAEHLRNLMPNDVQYEFTIKHLKIFKNILEKQKEFFATSTKLVEDYLKSKSAMSE